MKSELSGLVSTASDSAGSKKLGQPVPESNFVSELKSSCPQPLQRYIPSSWLSQYAPVNARSVPWLRRTSNSSALSCSRHACSDFETFSTASSFAGTEVSRPQCPAVTALPPSADGPDAADRAPAPAASRGRRADPAAAADPRLLPALRWDVGVSPGRWHLHRRSGLAGL